MDLIQNQPNQALVKFVTMFVFSFVLQILCSKGLGIISWIIVFIPFIFFTYITAVLFFVFGLDPDIDDLNENVEIIVNK